MKRNEALAWLNQSPDANGECDKCHDDGKLWVLPSEIDTEPDANWAYCAACFRKIVAKRIPA